MFITLYRILKFAVQNFFRNIWLSTVTVSILTLSLLSVNFFLLASAFTDTAVHAVEQRVNITVYMKPAAKDAEITALQTSLQQLKEVDSVEYVSKDTALAQLKAKYEQEKNPIIQESLNELDGNPLVGSLVIKAKSIEGYPAIQQALEQEQAASIIEKKDYQDRTTLIKKIGELKNNIGEFGYGINIFFALIAGLIVYNTIRITIYTRAREIGIMKLVGATNWFIRSPMVIESMLYSILAVGLTVAISYPLLGALQPYVDKFFDGQAFDVLGYFSSNFTTIFGYELLATLALNIISSALAIGRYLKV